MYPLLSFISQLCVWGSFLYCLCLGIALTKTLTLNIRAFLFLHLVLSIIYSQGLIYSTYNEFSHMDMALYLFLPYVLGQLIGTMWGSLFLEKTIIDLEKKRITIQGSLLPIVSLLAICTTKLFFDYGLGFYPDLFNQYRFVYYSIESFMIGIFMGRALFYLGRYHQRKKAYAILGR